MGFKTRLLAAAGVVGLVGSVLTAPTAAAAETRDRQCRDVTITVSQWGLSGPIRGTLCVPDGGASTLQVLVHGHTYDRKYWDWPQQPERYSYADAATERGFATLAIDRLGAGQSWKPAGVTITYSRQANMLNQVVETVRSGRFGVFGNVVTVGHSLGMFPVWVQAARHNNVDAVVSTGAAHELNPDGLLPRLPQFTHPAILDPKFIGTTLDPTYVTTIPGKRGIFYNRQAADPAVIARDNELRATGSLVDVMSVFPPFILRASRGIEEPVLTLIGGRDPLFCRDGPLAVGADCSNSAAFERFERGFYASSPSVTGVVVPHMGHSVNLHRDAPGVFRRVLDWSKKQESRGFQHG